MSNLLLLVFIPFIGACIALIVGATRIPAKYQKSLAFLLSLLPLAHLLIGFGSWNGELLRYPWISSIGIDFSLAMDPLSLFFVLLTAIITPIAISTVSSERQKSPGLYFFLILTLQGILFILFTAKDLALFTIAWESMLLPLYFIINFWGGSQRQSAALQFLIYMIAGSSLFVAGVLGLYFTAPQATFDLDTLATSAAQAPYAMLIFLAFIIAFAVKTPLFPFHAWLPETYVEAPFAGTILLSSLLSKAGIYGFARIGYGLFPGFMVQFSLPLLILAIIGALYAATTAWTQRGIKNVIAYSSLSHVNFILAGIFVTAPIAFQGAILQAFNHGITIGALFLITYWLQIRTGETTLGSFKGAAKYFPALCWFSLFFVLSSIALPATNSFVGELLILFGLFSRNMWLGSILALSVILSAIYMLRWIQKLYFEEPKEASLLNARDLGSKELSIAIPLAALILALGIYPAPWLKEIEPTALRIAEVTEHSEKNLTSDNYKTVLVQLIDILTPKERVQNLLAVNDAPYYDPFSDVIEVLRQQGEFGQEQSNSSQNETQAEERKQEEKRILQTQADRRLQEEHEQQRAADKRLDVEHELQRAAQNRRDVANTLQRDRDLRRIEQEHRLERQREDRRLEERRLQRQRENR